MSRDSGSLFRANLYCRHNDVTVRDSIYFLMFTYFNM